MRTRLTLREHHRRALLAFAGASIVVAATASAANPANASTQTTLQQDVNALHAAGATGVLAEVVDHGQSVKARAGVAFRELPFPVPFNGRYRTGSNTKTFIATVMLQLVAEGKLSLDDPVEKWLPRVVDGNGYDGSKITVRELLQHTSGIFDYTADSTFIPMLTSRDGFNATRFKHYSPRDLINIGLSHAPYFAPGTGFAYSNTNYIIAGEIIKAVTGHTWDIELARRIINPLHLTGTSAPGDNPLVPFPPIGGYNIFTSDPANRVDTNTTIDNITWAGAAGSLITTTADENHFYSALLAGKLLPSAQLAELKKGTPFAPSVGLGIGHQTLDCGVEIWGAVGEVVGYTTYTFTTTDGSRSVVLSVPTTTFTEPQFFNDSNLDSFNVIEHAYCPPTASSTATSARLRPSRTLQTGLMPPYLTPAG